MTEETAGGTTQIENKGTLIVQLLYKDKPELNKQSLTTKLQSIDPMISALGGDICLFLNERYHVGGAEDNPSGIVTVLPQESLNKELISPSLQQTFDWPGAKEALAYCNHGLVVADILGSALSAQGRLTCIQTVLSGVMEEHPPTAVHWLTSQRVVDPTKIVHEFKERGLSSIFAGAINVRSFRDQADLSNHIFDTLGLFYFGLIDFQCHFNKLEPAEVAAKLFNLAAYVYEKGNIIENGASVAGIGGDSWKCTLEWALAGPARPVIDLNPGELASARKS